MITAMVIIRLRTRPHAHNEALATGYVYGTLAILFAAEMAACMILDDVDHEDVRSRVRLSRIVQVGNPITTFAIGLPRRADLSASDR